MSKSFFDYNNYFVDEKVNFFKFANEYKVYDELGNQLGVIKQKLSTSKKILSLFINRTSMPFHLDILNNNNEIEASICRGWTFWMSKINILDKNQNIIAYIQQKFKFIKPSFKIFDTNNQFIGEISGDWKKWNFSITDSNYSKVGTINKKWAGTVKEIFTTADKYNINISQNIFEAKVKKAILASAIVIDMIFKEDN